MSSGFESSLAALEALRTRTKQAVMAAMDVIEDEVIEESQQLLPDKETALKSSAKSFTTVSQDGKQVVGTVMYGNHQTQTPWGVGQEVTKHTPGTDSYVGTPFLEQGTLNVMPSIGATFARHLSQTANQLSQLDQSDQSDQSSQTGQPNMNDQLYGARNI